VYTYQQEHNISGRYLLYKSKSDVKSLDFVATRFLMKLLGLRIKYFVIFCYMLYVIVAGS